MFFLRFLAAFVSDVVVVAVSGTFLVDNVFGDAFTFVVLVGVFGFVGVFAFVDLGEVHVFLVAAFFNVVLLFGDFCCCCSCSFAFAFGDCCCVFCFFLVRSSISLSRFILARFNSMRGVDETEEASSLSLSSFVPVSEKQNDLLV